VQIHDTSAARSAVERWLSPRFHALDKLERYAHGTQYEGRPNFYHPKVDVPLLERAPNIVHGITEVAIRQHCDFALGEGRFPVVTSEADEDEELLGEGISEESAKTLDAFMRVLMRHALFRSAATDALSNAEGCGTEVTVVAVKSGCPRLQSLPAKFCTPTFADGSVTSVEVRYPFVEFYQDRQREWRARAKLFRRIIDATSDTVFVPAEIGQASLEPKWIVDRANSVEHNLGFCPVVWYRFKSCSSQAGDIDGVAIHDTQLDEIDALNTSLSQRGRAALYAGDPQMWETGADQSGPPPGGIGRAALVEGAKRDTYVFGMANQGRPARRKGAGTVWSYESAEARVGMLTLPGDALAGISDHCADLEDKISQVLGYTAASIESVKGATSGKALGFMFLRTTTFVDGVREDFWNGWMEPTLSMLLRIVRGLETAAPGSVYVPGAGKVKPIIDTFVRKVGEAERWMPPKLRAVWPAYFTATAEDEKATVATVADAREAKLITAEMGLAKLAAIFPFDSADKVLEELEEERSEADAHGVQMAASALRTTPMAVEGDEAPTPEDEET
jgi:hypothetical protein